MLDQARRAPQTVTADWDPLEPIAIPGVKIKEIKNVIIRSGVLTECFRPEWVEEGFVARHVVYMSLIAGGMSSWHCHRNQTDLIIAVQGQIRIGLYDDRDVAAPKGRFKLLHMSVARPGALQVPPLVWHAIKNPTSEPAAYVVVNDEPYHYEEPDDWVLSPGAGAIPYSLD